MEIIQLLITAGIGGIIGSLLTTLVQAMVTRNVALENRRFQEKKEAYIGFLEAFTTSEIDQTAATAIKSGHWINRCELVASPEVVALLQRIRETNPSEGQVHPDRPKVMEALKVAMRVDLDIVC